VVNTVTCNNFSVCENYILLPSSLIYKHVTTQLCRTAAHTVTYTYKQTNKLRLRFGGHPMRTPLGDPSVGPACGTHLGWPPAGPKAVLCGAPGVILGGCVGSPGCTSWGRWLVPWWGLLVSPTASCDSMRGLGDLLRARWVHWGQGVSTVLSQGVSLVCARDIAREDPRRSPEEPLVHPWWVLWSRHGGPLVWTGRSIGMDSRRQMGALVGLLKGNSCTLGGTRGVTSVGPGMFPGALNGFLLVVPRGPLERPGGSSGVHRDLGWHRWFAWDFGCSMIGPRVFLWECSGGSPGVDPGISWVPWGCLLWGLRRVPWVGHLGSPKGLRGPFVGP
jgi:hypothetical protein